MAGREYKARDKSVQKMSRDGLVEENLRTGKSQRAVTGRIDAVRIGDRPMEHFKAAGDLSEDGRLDRISRGGRHGLRKEDAVREAVEKEALMNGVPEEDLDAAGHRNRVQRARSLRSGRLLLLWMKQSPGQRQASCAGKRSENILQMGQMEVARVTFQKDFSRTLTIKHFAIGGA